MADYKEAPITGTQWQRARRILIENPYQGKPVLNFIEERAEIKVSPDGERISTELCADDLRIEFDPENPEHMELYERLDALYVQAREARDAAKNP